MSQTSEQTKQVWLILPEPHSEIKIPPEYLRYPSTATIKNLLKRADYSVSLDSDTSQAPLTNLRKFFEAIETSSQVYKATVARQLTAALPPNVEETSFKDTPKTWFIKTADYGDDCDRVLQHPEGDFTQLMEDLARYHQKFQEGYDKVILLRPPTYTGYDIQLSAAMQCLGYTKEQFQFIIIQPIKLYAFHKPTNRIQPIPDLDPEELIKAIGMDALRWHSLRVPFTSVAPINISTAGQPTPADSLYRVQSAHARCCTLLYQAHQQGLLQLDTTQRDNWQISPAATPIAKCSWNSPHAEKLASQLQAAPKILSQSITDIALYRLVHYIETISEICHQWCDSLSLTLQACNLLLATKQTLFDLLENILTVTAPEPLLATN